MGNESSDCVLPLGDSLMPVSQKGMPRIQYRGFRDRVNGMQIGHDGRLGDEAQGMRK